MAWNASEARAARREALGEPCIVVWEGEEFTLRSEEDWDIDLNIALKEGRLADVLAMMMDPGEYDRLARLRKPSLGDAKALFEHAQEFYGYGESPGE